MIPTTKSLRSLLLAIATGLCLAAMPAFAQEPPPAGSEVPAPAAEDPAPADTTAETASAERWPRPLRRV